MMKPKMAKRLTWHFTRTARASLPVSCALRLLFPLIASIFLSTYWGKIKKQKEKTIN